MAALTTRGNWLQGSGWVQALVQAEITSAVTADSFLRASHVSRTRRRNEELEFDNWCQQQAKTCPQWQFWCTFAPYA